MERMHNPPHPRLTVRDDVLPAVGFSVIDAAQQFGLSRGELFHVLNGRPAISPEMELRIEAWLGMARGGEAILWMTEQSAYNMWKAWQRFKATPNAGATGADGHMTISPQAGPQTEKRDANTQSPTAGIHCRKPPTPTRTSMGCVSPGRADLICGATS